MSIRQDYQAARDRVVELEARVAVLEDEKRVLNTMVDTAEAQVAALTDDKLVMTGQLQASREKVAALTADRDERAAAVATAMQTLATVEGRERLLIQERASLRAERDRLAAALKVAESACLDGGDQMRRLAAENAGDLRALVKLRQEHQRVCDALLGLLDAGYRFELPWLIAAATKGLGKTESTLPPEENDNG